MTITDAVTRALGAGMTLARGHVVQIKPGGKIRVRLDAAGGREVLCDVLRTGPRAPRFVNGDEVLIAAPEGADKKAIVIGVVGGAAPEGETPAVAPPDETTAPRQDAKPGEQRITDRRIVVEAGEELVLQCGEASITIRRDGKIVIRGQHILSRAKGTQRIKGGSVAIN